MDYTKLRQLIGNHTVLIHKDDYSDIELHIKAPITTTDLRYTKGRYDTISHSPSLILYCVHSHEPQQKTASILSQYLTKNPVIIIGDKKSIKSLMKSFAVKHRILYNNTAIYYLEQQTVHPQPITTHQITYTKNITSTFTTQKGLFSYTQIDTGTDFLLDTITLADHDHVLDFACGYGVIGIMLKKMHPIHLTASDSNITAIEYTKKNCITNNIQANIIHSYLLNAISDTFNIIISNPPTHLKREEVTLLFHQCSQRLKKNGSVWIVINKIVAYETIATPYFNTIQTIATRDTFKILRLSQPITT